jgi:thiol:disulfide interchange protein
VKKQFWLSAFVWAALLSAAAHANPFSSSATFSPGQSAGEGELSVTLTVPEHHYLYADRVEVSGEEASGVVLERKSGPDPMVKHILEETVRVYERDCRLVYAVHGMPAAWVVAVAYQGCDEKLCYPPVKDLFRIGRDGSVTSVSGNPEPVPELPREAGLAAAAQLIGRESGYLSPKEMTEFLDRVESGQGLGKDRLAGMLERRGIWIALLMILVWGLALNLTPCVLPMIPINLAIIGAGSQSGSRSRGFALGGVYGAGIAAVYGLLGLVVVLTGAKFGTLNASPWFNLGIAVLFGTLGLAMFDVFSVDFSRFQPKGDSSRKAGLVSAFFMGGVAALLAGACVAPVVISVLLLSAKWYSAGQPAGLLLPFLLGAGMALPWPFAGAGLSFLPKPGRWMERVKQGFGALILIAAAYYGYLGTRLLSDRLGVDRSEVASAHARQASEGGWLVSLDEGMAQAAREGKPVFVDFWASWCKNCLKMEKTTFRDAAVRQRLDKYIKVKYQAEDLRAPATKAVLDRYGAIGLPTYVVLRPVAAVEGGSP